MTDFFVLNVVTEFLYNFAAAFVKTLEEDENARGLAFTFLTIVCSYPAYILVLCLRKIPQNLLAKERIPYILAFFALVFGVAVGVLGIIDQSHGIQAFTTACFMAAGYKHKLKKENGNGTITGRFLRRL
jgi:tellurite resistance protein TehA-like permease